MLGLPQAVCFKISRLLAKYLLEYVFLVNVSIIVSVTKKYE